MEWLVATAGDYPSPVVVAHNDLLPANVMRVSCFRWRSWCMETSALRVGRSLTSHPCYRSWCKQKGDDITLIDFEYSDWNTRGFDLANHFLECVRWSQPHVSPSYLTATGADASVASAWDSRPQARRFRVRVGHDAAVRGAQAGLLQRVPGGVLCWQPQRLRCGYDAATVAGTAWDSLHSLAILACATELEAVVAREAKTLDREVSFYSLTSNMFWGLWGILQQAHSTIPFEYLPYSSRRVARYFDEKQRLLAA